MMRHDEFALQDFLTDESHFEKMSHVKSILVKGDKSYKPFFSIVIPTYKRADLLREAIESCIAQESFEDFNIVITDNDPERENETESMLENICCDKILYYKNEENIGALANFNRCIEMATGTYAIMLNTDDLLDKEYLQKMSLLLRKYPEADMMIPDMDIEMNGMIKKTKGYHAMLKNISKIFGRAFRLEEKAVKLNIYDFILYNPACSPSGVVYRRQAFLSSPGFNPEWHPTGDKILYINKSLKQKVYLSGIPAGRYRFINNITLEDGMRTLLLEQGCLINRYLSKKLNKGWIEKYYKGAVYYRLKRPSNNKFGIGFNEKSIGLLFDRFPDLSDFIFFAIIWVFAAVSWHYRAFKTVLTANAGAEV